MIDNQKYSNLVEAYFEGNLTPAEMLELENEVSVNAELKNEFELQRDIINSIKDTRRLELKTRLDNIQVHWYHTIPNGLKIAAAISALTITSLSAFYIADQNSGKIGKLDLSDGNNAVEVIAFEEKTLSEKPSVSEDLTQPEKILPETETTIIADTKPEKIVVKKDETSKEVPANHEFEVYVPENTDEFAEVEGIDMKDMEAKEMVSNYTAKDNMSSSVEIKSIQHKKYNFHYKFDEGRLSLYGDFGTDPYEILEINSQTGKKFYLKLKENFYLIQQTDKIKLLDPVTDENLINELKIAEENK